MKRYCFILLGLLGLLLSGCKQPVQNNTEKKPTLTIHNMSSFEIDNIKWNGTDFGNIEVGGSEKKAVSKGIGYIYFSFEPKNSEDNAQMNCNTGELLSVESEDLTFIFTNSTIVVQQKNTGNRATLEDMEFPNEAVLTVSIDSRDLVNNDVVSAGDSGTQVRKTIKATITNTGNSTLTLTGNSPVKIIADGESSYVFSVDQPAQSVLKVNQSTEFRIHFTPSEKKVYTGKIQIDSSDKKSPFVFTVNGRGVDPIPEITVTGQDGVKISNYGTLDFGYGIIGVGKAVDITIENTGFKKLTLTGNPAVKFSGEAGSFKVLSQPLTNISMGEKATFRLQYLPDKEIEEGATLIIESDDPSNPVFEIYLRGKGEKVYPTFKVEDLGNSVQVKDGDSISEKTARKDNGCTDVFRVTNLSTVVNMNLSAGTAGGSPYVSVECDKNILKPGESANISVKFSPGGSIVTTKEKIVLTTDCKDPEFEFNVSYKSRELSTVAELYEVWFSFEDMAFSYWVSEGQNDVYIDSSRIGSAVEFTLESFNVSDNVSIYLNDTLLTGDNSVEIVMPYYVNIEVVPETGENRRLYSFDIHPIDDYDSVDFDYVVFGFRDELDYDIWHEITFDNSGLYSGIYYADKSPFYLYFALENPNAEVYYQGVDGNFYEYENGSHTASLYFEDYPNNEICFRIYSESWNIYKDIKFIYSPNNDNFNQIYLRGTMNDWGGYLMNKKTEYDNYGNEVTYWTYTCDLEPGLYEFKFGIDDNPVGYWGLNWGPMETTNVSLNNVYTSYSNIAWNFNIQITTKGFYTFEFYEGSYTVTVKKG